MRCLVLALVVALSAPAFAGPVTLAVSGYLLDANDEAVTAASQAVQFRVFDRASGSGEVLLWEAACSVEVRQGCYAVTLGSAPCAGTSTLTSTHLPPDATRWLEVQVGAVVLAPRLAIAPVPAAAQALDAQTLGGLPPAAFAPATHTHATTDVTNFDTAAVSAATASGAFATASHSHATANGTTTGFLSSTDWTTFSTGTVAGSRLAGTYPNALALTNTGNTYAGTFTGTLGNVSFGGRATLPKASSAPYACDAAAAADVYFDTTQNKALVCDGTAWAALGGGAQPGTAALPGTDCLTLKNQLSNPTDGEYWLDPDGTGGNAAFKTWCDMSHGGWTLVLKLKSTGTLLDYDSTYWTTDTTLAGTLDPSADEDVKTLAYSTVSLNEVRYCLDSQANCVSETRVAASAKALFTSVQASAITRAQFMALDPLADSNFNGQPNCNAAGYNLFTNAFTCRYGIAFNNENDCASNDSGIGFGCKRNGYVNKLSAGAIVWPSAEPAVNYPRRGWIWVRSGDTTLGSAAAPALSCSAILAARPTAQDGVYWLDTDAGGANAAFQAYCDMTNGGWTLVMKFRSSGAVLSYDSAHWTTDTSLNLWSVDASPDDDMKNQAYNALAFTQVRHCLDTVANCVQENRSYASAKALFSASVTSSFTRANYMSWDPQTDSTYNAQPNCNQSGYNVGSSTCNCRFGLIMNNENDCNSNDSGIGFGCKRTSTNTYVSSGSIVWPGSEPSIAIPRRGWVFVK